MKLNPLSNRVVIKFVEAEEKTSGGIFLTAAAQEKPQIAEVIAIGPGKITDNGTFAPMTVKVGDKVITSKYAGTQVKIDGEELITKALTLSIADKKIRFFYPKGLSWKSNAECRMQNAKFVSSFCILHFEFCIIKKLIAKNIWETLLTESSSRCD